MECNKDEAMRAKDIAERKFTEKNYSGAKKFAVKAQNLYPGLEGISQLLATIDIYILAEKRVGGEMDLYGILGVHPFADDETIKKQYRKLVLQLHPDKNKSIGADGAFQFVTDAHGILSDKVKRSAYNTRRHIQIAQRVPSQSGVPGGAAGNKQQHNFSTQSVPLSQPAEGVSDLNRTAEQILRNQWSRAAQQKAPSQSGSSAVPPGVNGHCKHAGASSSRGKYKKSGTKRASSQAQSFFKKGDTFWTVCARCKMQYEYMRVYLNQMLKCPHCEVGFVAVEIPPPSNLAPLQPEKQQRGSFSNSGLHASGVRNSFGAAGARWSPSSGVTAYHSSTPVAAGHSQSTMEGQVVKEGLKRKNEEAQAAGKWNSSFDLRGEGPSKRFTDMGGTSSRNYGSSIPCQPVTGNIDFSMPNAYGPSSWHSHAGRANGFAAYTVRVNFNKEASPAVVKKLLSEKALGQVSTEVQNSDLITEKKLAAKEKMKKPKLANSMQEPGSYDNSSGSQIGSQPNNISIGDSVGLVEQVAPEFSVPDSDFHVFDYDRLEGCFSGNQVWAGYDDDDGMPRAYALIHEVVSMDPFKLRISWLNSRSNTEFDTLDWVGHGFKKTCGDFWVGKHETTTLLNSFSHKVMFGKGPRGVIQIYPREGDIWALYKNWSPDWTRLNTPHEVIHAYDMVEVLQDYNEEQGVYVASITKAAGFQTVFLKQADPKVVMHIPKEEMFRFSHQVPHHILTGAEKPDAPKGLLELDPAAIPAELLQVTAGTSQEPVIVLQETAEIQPRRHE